MGSNREQKRPTAVASWSDQARQRALEPATRWMTRACPRRTPPLPAPPPARPAPQPSPSTAQADLAGQVAHLGQTGLLHAIDAPTASTHPPDRRTPLHRRTCGRYDATHAPATGPVQARFPVAVQPPGYIASVQASDSLNGQAGVQPGAGNLRGPEGVSRWSS
jgi:hypothetical protein